MKANSWLHYNVEQSIEKSIGPVHDLASEAVANSLSTHMGVETEGLPIQTVSISSLCQSFVTVRDSINNHKAAITQNRGLLTFVDNEQGPYE